LVREIRHRELARIRSFGAQIIDVLPSHEYDTAHIRGAVHLPLGRLIRETCATAPTATLDRKRSVVVYCRDSL
jgi:rhodanese-related sulfurtransferase